MHFPTLLVSKNWKSVLISISILLALASFLTACGGNDYNTIGGTNDTSTGSSAPVPTSPSDTSTPTTGDGPIDGISCQPEMSSYHIHIRLFIYDNGNLVPIPGTIGHGVTGCLYWIHTHDDDASNNIIHIEAPQSFTPILQNLWDIWHQTDPQSFPADFTTPDGVTVWVNGSLETGGFDAITFGEHDVVTVAYNTTGITPGTPDGYDWTGY